MSRILVVDDHPDVCRITGMILRSAGHEVDTTLSGEEAWELLQHRDYALVLLDIMLPVLNGHELLQRIRSHPQPTKAQTRIIYISALSSDAHIAHGFAGGADDYIPKPFGPGELLARCALQLQHYHELSALTIPTPPPVPKPVELLDFTCGPRTLSFNLATGQLSYEGMDQLILTHEEFLIFRYLAARSNHITSWQDLTRYALEREPKKDGSDIVRNHVFTLRQKLYRLPFKLLLQSHGRHSYSLVF